MAPKECFYRLCCTVTQTNPNDFRRKTAHQAEVAEVGVFGDNQKAFPPSKLPDNFIVRAVKP